jgi:hypothetical protein
MAASELTAERRTALAAFYAEQHTHLASRVERRVRGLGEEIVAEACGFAWLQLVRRCDVRLGRSGLAWLTLVAIHEAWRLGDPSRERAAGAFLSCAIDDELRSRSGSPATRWTACSPQNCTTSGLHASRNSNRESAATSSSAQVATATARFAPSLAAPTPP